MPVAYTVVQAPKFIVNRPDPAALAELLPEQELRLYAVVIRLAWQLGLTRGEIHSLDWSQVDFTASQVHLRERTVPMEPEIQVFLQRLLTARPWHSGPVVLTDRSGVRPAEQHLSYVCRKALDRVGQNAVRLLDLRYDYIIRQLEKHDWQYVSRVSGLDPLTLQLHLGQKPPGRSARQTGRVDPDRLQAILDAEGLSACGAALRLVWQLGLSNEELIRLDWEMFSGSTLTLPTRTLTVPQDLRPWLAALRRENGATGPVLLSDRAKRPMQNAQISRSVRAALIRGGCDDLTLRDLRRDCEIRRDCETPVLEYLQEHPRIVRSEAAALLGLSPAQTNACLRRMTERGTLARSGHCYYLPGAVVAPEQQRETVLAYLSAHPGCRRGELTRLLGLEARQCLTVLDNLVKAGDIERKGTKYYPAGQI